MRLNSNLLKLNLSKNNYYKNDWILIKKSSNSVNYYIKNKKMMIKIYKLSKYEKKITDTQNFFDIHMTIYSKNGYCNSFREVFLLQKMQNLIKKKICEHYPILITYKIINQSNSKCKICNELIKKKISKYKNSTKLVNYLKSQLESDRYLYIYKEYIDYPFSEIFKKKYDNTFWLVVLFQILYIFYINNKYLDLVNYDIHLNNIFFNKIQKGGYLYYTINNIKYKIPNIGYIFIVTDYGNSLSKQFKLNKNELYNYNFLYNIHYDVISFFRNFKLKKIKLFYLNWYNTKSIKNERKNKFPLIYKNTKKKYPNITDKQLNIQLTKKILKNNKFFKKFIPKIYLPSSEFSSIINKYSKYIDQNIKTKKLPKLDPEIIIKNEFKKFII